MAKRYEIQTMEDWNIFKDTMESYFNKVEKFPRIIIDAKRWRKLKTPQQHRKYFAVVNEAVKAFREVGYDVTTDELHEYFKLKAGFTKTREVNGEIIITTKSLKDASEDATRNEVNRLIDFIIRWVAQNLNYVIDHEIL